MVRRSEADRPGPQRIGGEIVRPQPRLARAPPKRRLVDGGREAPGRTRGQRASIAGPGDVHELTRGPAHAGDLDMAPKPRKGPIERTREPGRAILLTAEDAYDHFGG